MPQLEITDIFPTTSRPTRSLGSKSPKSKQAETRAPTTFRQAVRTPDYTPTKRLNRIQVQIPASSPLSRDDGFLVSSTTAKPVTEMRRTPSSVAKSTESVPETPRKPKPRPTDDRRNSSPAPTHDSSAHSTASQDLVEISSGVDDSDCEIQKILPSPRRRGATSDLKANITPTKTTGPSAQPPKPSETVVEPSVDEPDCAIVKVQPSPRAKPDRPVAPDSEDSGCEIIRVCPSPRKRCSPNSRRLSNRTGRVQTPTPINTSKRPRSSEKSSRTESVTKRVFHLDLTDLVTSESDYSDTDLEQGASSPSNPSHNVDSGTGPRDPPPSSQAEQVPEVAVADVSLQLPEPDLDEQISLTQDAAHSLDVTCKREHGDSHKMLPIKMEVKGEPESDSDSSPCSYDSSGEESATPVSQNLEIKGESESDFDSSGEESTIPASQGIERKGEPESEPDSSPCPYDSSSNESGSPARLYGSELNKKPSSDVCLSDKSQLPESSPSPPKNPPLPPSASHAEPSKPEFSRLPPPKTLNTVFVVSPARDGVPSTPRNTPRDTPIPYTIRPAYQGEILVAMDRQGLSGKFEPHHRNAIVGLRSILKTPSSLDGRRRSKGIEDSPVVSSPSERASQRRQAKTRRQGVSPSKSATPRDLHVDLKSHVQTSRLQDGDEVLRGKALFRDKQSDQDTVSSLLPAMGSLESTGVESNDNELGHTSMAWLRRSPATFIRLVRDGVSEYAIKPTVARLQKRIAAGEAFPGVKYASEYHWQSEWQLPHPRPPRGNCAMSAELEHRGVKTGAQYGNFWYNLMIEYSRLAGSPVPLFTMMKKALDDFQEECMEIRRDLQPKVEEKKEKRPEGLEALLLWGAGDTDEDSPSSSDEDVSNPVSTKEIKVDHGNGPGHVSRAMPASHSVEGIPNWKKRPALDGHAASELPHVKKRKIGSEVKRNWHAMK